MKETKWDRKLNDELCSCLECHKFFYQDRDIQLCDNCIKKFDLEKLWKMHDKGEIDALDFNESKKIRDMFWLEISEHTKKTLKEMRENEKANMHL